MSRFYKANKTDDIVCASGSNLTAASFPTNDAMTDFHVWCCLCNLTPEPFFSIPIFPCIIPASVTVAGSTSVSTAVCGFLSFTVKKSQEISQKEVSKDLSWSLVKCCTLLEYCMASHITEKESRGLSSCSGCLVFKCLANHDGFTVLANISRHTIHLRQGSSLPMAGVNL